MILLVALGVAAVSSGAERTIRRSSTMREGPASYFPVVMPLEPGTQVSIAETRGPWLQGTTGGRSGWIAQLAFEALSAGIDYAGMLGSEKALVISSVDIAAATKGAFEANYAETHKTDFARVDTLEQLRIPPALVSRILQGLPQPDTRILAGLPKPAFANNVIIPADSEQLLGRALTATLVTPGFVESAEAIAYVNAVAAVVGMRTPRYDLPFRVALTDDPGINGFGLPGGNVVLTRGLLGMVRNEAELACQIGHEIAHITLYHGLREFQKRGTHRKSDSAFSELDAMGGNDDPFAELNALTGDTSRTGVEADLTRLANTSYLTIIGKRARTDELEADLFGVAYAAAAGYDPNAMISYLERVRALGTGPDAFRHHPSLDERIAALREGIRRYRLAAGTRVLEQERFKLETAGLQAKGEQ
jgi:Zn-dependent protease with chaperone function